jgi:hypothetical protein
MDSLPGLSSLTLRPLTKVLLLNRGPNPIRVDGEALGPPFVINTGSFEEREARRGDDLWLSTLDMDRSSYELFGWEPGLTSIERTKLTIPLETENTILFGWDGLAWCRMDPRALDEIRLRIFRLHIPEPLPRRLVIAL